MLWTMDVYGEYSGESIIQIENRSSCKESQVNLHKISSYDL